MTEATAEATHASSSSTTTTGTTTHTEPSGRVVTTTRTNYAELDAATAPIGGLLGVPQLVTMVGALMPGGAGLPPTWGAWLRKRIEDGKPVVLACETDGEAWRLEIASSPCVEHLPPNVDDPWAPGDTFTCVRCGAIGRIGAA